MALILNIALALPIYQQFDYLVPPNSDDTPLKKGLRVLVPFGNKKKIGYLVDIANHSKLPLTQLKKALTVLDTTPLLPDTLLKLIEWASAYYHHPLGEVFANALPVLLRDPKQISYTQRSLLTSTAAAEEKPASPIEPSAVSLNLGQQQAVTTVLASHHQFKPFLLNGVTGSGKTEVYLEVIAATLQANKQVLVLIPEIGLTPQMLARFQQRFAVPLVVFHSALSNKQRFDNWLLAKQGKAKIILGTRSALFTPLLKPGLIIIDEEHDASFKQQTGLRYHARDLALVRAKLENIPILMGSATASLETIANAQRQRYHLLSLPNRAGKALPPDISLIDLRQQPLEQGFSPQLLNHMAAHLNRQCQVLLFLNRRGFAPITLCNHCGWIANCHRCEKPMVLHKLNSPQLKCHYCGQHCPPPTQCVACQSSQLVVIGQGTQSIEATLKKHFPNRGIARLDRDNTHRKGSLEALLTTIHSGESQILIGTQMLAKGHHFPNVTLVGILEADTGLFSADFRALERTGQLILQVAGRAGRAEKPGCVLIQTHYPEHPLLKNLISQDYLSFSTQLLAERKATLLPPYSHLALIQAEALAAADSLDFLERLKQTAQRLNAAVVLLGPIAALLPKRAGYYRAHLLLQAKKRSELHRVLVSLIAQLSALRKRERVRWSLDVDPLDTC